MEHSNTYKAILKLITNRKKKGTLTQHFIEDMQYKLDIFLTADRITSEEYQELMDLLKKEK